MLNEMRPFSCCTVHTAMGSNASVVTVVPAKHVLQNPQDRKEYKYYLEYEIWVSSSYLEDETNYCSHSKICA
jgi:hypothetical protein